MNKNTPPTFTNDGSQVDMVIEDVKLDTPLKWKDFPFTAEHFLEAVDNSAKRSRRILLIIIFTSIIILMALVNSCMPEYSWFASKSTLYRDISSHIFLSDSQQNHALKRLKFKDYIFQNEALTYKYKLRANDSLQLLKLSNDYQGIPVFLISPSYAPVYGENFKDRLKIYNRLGKAIHYTANHQIVSSDIFNNYIDNMDGAEIEHIDMVRVPILGVSFHINYLGFYSGITLIVLYFLFYFSLKREDINTKIAFKRGWNIEKYHHYYYYEYVSMLQVLSIPRKLFVRQESNFLYKSFSKTAVFFPFLIYMLVIMYDGFSFAIGKEVNGFLSLLTIFFNFVFGVTMFFLQWLVRKKWGKMDRMWDNQALEFNFECILEKLNIDQNHQFTKLTTSTLTEQDLQRVKQYWFEKVNSFLSQSPVLEVQNTGSRLQGLLALFPFLAIFNRKLDKKYSRLFDEQHSEKAANKCLVMYSEFINDLLTKDYLDGFYGDDHENVQCYWDELYGWYCNFGRKEMTSVFRREFLQMILRIRRIAAAN